MDAEMKKIFRNNVIKFIIGAGLLIISYGYIQNHPAERASIFSGFDVLRQKVEVFFYKLTNSDSEGLKLKFDYQKNLDELINTAKNNSCVQSNVIDELNELSVALKKERITKLENNLTYYQRKFGEYKTLIDNACKK